MTAKKITIEGFLDEFKSRHEQMEDRPFCWVLGSGASIQSGIPTGTELVQKWLEELHKLEDFEKIPLDEWATAEKLGIRGFEFARASTFYPWVYHRRFRDYREQGYAFLEKAMKDAEPSFGYSVLAQIMAHTHHKVVITTNFDNLIADALSVYTRTFPLVCGHESLTGYIRANLRRPLVAKIHRDLLLAPLSNPDEIAKLPGEWAVALKKILGRFTPIVIGYGGNDGSLMGFLDELDPVEGGIFWCYREGTEIDDKIQKVVGRHHGRLVPIAGFDELMLQFQVELELPSLLPELQNFHEKRVTAYRKQFQDLTAALTKPAEPGLSEVARRPVRKAAEAAVERLTKENDWWAWVLKASAEPDLAMKETIYRYGLDEFPNSAELTGDFASFMWDERKNYDEAEQLYRKALELDPNSLANITNFATFMSHARKNYDEAERLYRKALELDPNDVFNIVGLAQFMWRKRKDYDEAERLYRKALELDPKDSDNKGSFALFMWHGRKNNDEAERLYHKALDFDSNDPRNLGNFTQLLAAMDRIPDARELATRAWQLLGDKVRQTRAEVAFTRWLLDRSEDKNGAPGLGRLKTVLETGFRRSSWSFDDLLATLEKRIPEGERPLARKLADAILHEDKVSALEDEPLWNEVEPIPLTVPWLD